MERPPHISEERKDLEINTIEGLELFLESVEDTYSDLKGAAASSEAAALTLERGDQAYHDVTAVIERCVSSLKAGGEVSDEDVDTMQFLYNELIAALDTIVPIAPAPEALSEPALPETIEPHNNNEEAEIVSEEDIEDLRESTTTVIETIEALLQKYKMPVQTSHGAGSSFDAAGHFYDELGMSKIRAQALMEEMTRKESELQELVLFTQLEDRLQEIEKKVQDLEEGLEAVLNPKPSTAADREWLNRPATGALVISHEDHHPAPVKISRPSPAIIEGSVASDFSDVSHEEPSTPVRTIQHRLEDLKPKSTSERPRPLKEYMERALMRADDRAFVIQGFGSIEKFEKELEEEIRRIESIANHQFLGGDFKSVFETFLKEMTLAEIREFHKQAYEVKKAIFAEKNISYDVYYEWMNKLDQSIVFAPAMKFGEALVRAEIAFFKEKYRQ